MSKPPSPNPSSNTFSTNIIPSPKSTNSRTHPHEHIPSASAEQGDHQAISSPSQAHSLPSSDPPHASRALKRSGSPITEQPMTKRLRKQPLDVLTRETSPLSDYQDDSADMELESEHDQLVDAPAPVVPPPKKKRTRTLTTPHQSAVLHALLAQSRFPSTSVREEVGRRIGLSQRKVQIWFQNQRQKARRPRSQGDASRRRFPQYGPFPSGPEDPASGSYPFASEHSSHTSRLLQPGASSSGGAGYPGTSGYPSPESLSGPLESPTQLLGPGMPGSELQSELPYRGHVPLSPRPSTAVELCVTSSSRTSNTTRHFLRSPSPPRLYPLPPTVRPMTASRLLDRDFSRTLPPLVFNQPSKRASLPVPAPTHHGMLLQASTSRLTLSPPYTRRSMSPESNFAHHPPDAAFCSSVNLGPPYTLQPAPQWDNSTFTSTLQSSNSPLWARQGPRSLTGSLTPPGSSRDLYSPITDTHTRVSVAQPAGGAPAQRPGRYDPVRAMYIYTTPSDRSPGTTPNDDDRSPRADTNEDVREDLLQTPS